MQTSIQLAVSLFATALLSATPSAQAPQHRRAKAPSASELFSSACIACHVPPDPKFATDLAWLNQVTDTA